MSNRCDSTLLTHHIIHIYNLGMMWDCRSCLMSCGGSKSCGSPYSNALLRDSIEVGDTLHDSHGYSYPPLGSKSE
ncbi:hypothetical protein CEXT_478241 [Caerostris extrusa]|uniref:Uncharacterized protein n=1 Tax=Caerostris extrusa TaxID=172846 RepID=A0AAV4Y517_CAEEX|nr:hypothetical protein CEXT_478241 [Caerostris extrusa]